MKVAPHIWMFELHAWRHFLIIIILFFEILVNVFLIFGINLAIPLPLLIFFFFVFVLLVLVVAFLAYAMGSTLFSIGITATVLL